MELKKSNFTINKTIKNESHEITADGDIIVPDIKPDILKVMQVSGNCVIANKELTDGKLTIDGRVDFTVLYIPDTENDKIASISSYFDFTHVINDESLNSDCYIQTACDLKRIDFQLINSRKLRIKSLSELSLEAGIIEPVEIAEDTDGNDNPQILKKCIKILSTTEKKVSDFTVHEKAELVHGQSSICELLRTDVKITDKEFKTINGRIIAKGSLGINILFTDSEGCIRFCDFSLPFTEIFEAENVRDDTICEIDYTLGDISAKVTADSDGDPRCIDFDILIFASITASEEKEIEYICDCYCPGYETNLDTTEMDIDALCTRTSVSQNIRDIISPQKSHSMQAIYNIPSQISISSTNVMTDKTIVEGNIICFMIYTADSDENPVCSIKKEIPFTISAETPGSTDKMLCDINAEISHINYSINSSGEAEVRAIINLDLKVFEPSKMVIIKEAELMPLSENSKKGIVLYFVQPGDTLWNIAKHYHASVEDIASLNNIENEALEVGMKLVIPTV